LNPEKAPPAYFSPESLPMFAAPAQRFENQIRFVDEIGRLKSIVRQTYLLDGSRKENSAEHSWQLAMMVVVFAEYAAEPINISHSLTMALIHDIVEIDAGDTYLYDDEALVGAAQREQGAAARIFGLLPPESGEKLRALWEEFEAQKTAEARFVRALDRFSPLSHNFATQGRSWIEHGVSRSQVVEKCSCIARGAPRLWERALQMVEEATRKGWLRDS
jgi:putative hydrolase of HD superfamily